MIHDYAAHGAQLLCNTSHKNEYIIQSLQLLLQLFYHKKNLFCLLLQVCTLEPNTLINAKLIYNIFVMGT